MKEHSLDAGGLLSIVLRSCSSLLSHALVERLFIVAYICLCTPSAQGFMYNVAQLVCGCVILRMNQSPDLKCTGMLCLRKFFSGSVSQRNWLHKDNLVLPALLFLFDVVKLFADFMKAQKKSISILQHVPDVWTHRKAQYLWFFASTHWM